MRDGTKGPLTGVGRHWSTIRAGWNACWLEIGCNKTLSGLSWGGALRSLSEHQVRDAVLRSEHPRSHKVSRPGAELLESQVYATRSAAAYLPQFGAVSGELFFEQELRGNCSYNSFLQQHKAVPTWDVREGNSFVGVNMRTRAAQSDLVAGSTRRFRSN